MDRFQAKSRQGNHKSSRPSVKAVVANATKNRSAADSRESCRADRTATGTPAAAWSWRGGLGRVPGRAMPFVVYVAILAVALFSVALEWDTLVAPSTTTRHAMQPVGELGKPAAQRDTVQPPPPLSHRSRRRKPPRRRRLQSTTVRRRRSATRRGAKDRRAAMRRHRLHRRLSHLPGVGLHLCSQISACAACAPRARRGGGSASRRPAPHRCRAAMSAPAPSPTARFNPQDCTYQPLDGPRQLCKK